MNATETKLAHTPGPWINCNTHVDDSLGRPLIRDARNFDNLNPLDHKLIAAAPDLLAACESVLSRLDLEPVDSVFPCSAMRDQLRAAIAKAAI